MIPENRKDEVISTGISFLRSITEAFGQETGLELWDTISNTLDPDVKGQIFFAMLCGQESSSITIRGFKQENANKIQVIKAIRTVTDLGLKDVKDIADVLMVGNHSVYTPMVYMLGKPVTIRIGDKNLDRAASVRVLCDAGCLI